MSESKVAIEICEAEFERFAAAMDLDLDPKSMDDDDRKSFEDQKRKIVRAMQSGHLVINEPGEPVYTLAIPVGDVRQVIFHEPTGASYMAMDSKKTGHNVKKGTAVLAEVTRQAEVTFAKMANRDYKVCQAILALFLG